MGAALHLRRQPGGQRRLQWLQFQTKTANYAIVASDNFTQLDNAGAVGEVDFTALPPIANGYKFGFRAVAAQTLKVISNEGRTSSPTTTRRRPAWRSRRAGRRRRRPDAVPPNAAGTKWFAENISAGANTVTVA